MNLILLMLTMSILTTMTSDDDTDDDDTDGDIDHTKDSYTAAGGAPDAGAAPGPGLRKHQNPNKTQT